MRTRRFLGSLSLALAAFGTLAACSGAGSALNLGSATPSRVIITSGGRANQPRVLAGSGIALSATTTAGSLNGTLAQNTFIWSATVVNGGTYVADQTGTTKPCASVTAGPSAAGPFSPFAPDYGIFIAIDPVNEGNIIFFPPLTVPVASGMFLGPLSSTNAYCVTVRATAMPGNVTGSITVPVVDPQFPLQ